MLKNYKEKDLVLKVIYIQKEKNNLAIQDKVYNAIRDFSNEKDMISFLIN